MADAKVEIRLNGPLRVYGEIEIVDADGKNYTVPEGQWRFKGRSWTQWVRV